MATSRLREKERGTQLPDQHPNTKQDKELGGKGVLHNRQTKTEIMFSPQQMGKHPNKEGNGNTENKEHPPKPYSEGGRQPPNKGNPSQTRERELEVAKHQDT